jgi:hypothetical protein
MRRLSVILFLLVFILGKTALVAQTEPSQTDRDEEPLTPVKKKKVKGQFKANWKLPYPNPYRAAIYTMIIPGAGQIYNKRYWKAPIVWGGYVGLVISVNYNKELRDKLELAYGQRLSGIPDEYVDRIRDAETLRRLRNSYDKNLQLSYIGFFGMFALSALDAYVDAHLKAFDIGDDLSLALRPLVRVGTGGIGVGIYLRPGDH